MTKIQPGQQYGKWTILEKLPYRNMRQMWLCQCECGTRRAITYLNLSRGKTTQCNKCGYKNRKQVQPKVKVRVNGQMMFFRDAAKQLGIKERTIRTRYYKGLPIDAPIHGGGRIGILLTYKGEKLCMADWARKFGVTREAIRQRLERGQKIGKIAKVYGF